MWWNHCLCGVVVTVLLGLPVSGQSIESRLCGEWRFDLGTTIADMRLREGDERIRALTREVTLFFKADGQASARFDDQPPQQMRWEAVRERPPKGLEIRLFDESSPGEKGTDAFVEFVDQHTFRFTLFTEGPVVFKRTGD